MENPDNRFIKYSPNYDIDIVTREDILSNIANSTEEWYRINDIVKNIELTAKRCIGDDLTCHIPYLGTFKHNLKCCYTRHRDEILALKRQLDPVEYIVQKKTILRQAVKEELAERRFRAILPARINKHKKWYNYLLTKKPKHVVHAIMVLSPENFTPPIGYNIENEKV